MRVVVEIPDRQWALLVDRADAHGLRVSDIVLAGIESVMPHRRPLGADVVSLVKAGMPDGLIAERLGVVQGTVAKIRRRAGLPANHFRSRSGGTNERKSA